MEDYEEDSSHTRINDPDKSIESMLMPDKRNFNNESAVIYQESQESLAMLQTKEPAAGGANSLIKKL